LYKKQSHSIDDVYKLAKTVFADRDDILADFRTFLPALEGSNSEMPAEEPDQQPTLAPKKVKFVHLSPIVRESEAPRKSGRRAEIARKGKEKMETTKSLEVER
jgi:histone deacetylase complex regulatory component SIN3